MPARKPGQPKSPTPHVTRRPAGRRSEASENYLLALRILEEDGVAPHISQLAE